MLRRLLGRGDSSEVQRDEPPDDLEARVPQISVTAPKGLVVKPSGMLDLGAVRSWLTDFGTDDYTHQELRQAATLPMVRSIISTIARDVSTA